MFKHQTAAARTLLLLAILMFGHAQGNTTSPGESLLQIPSPLDPEIGQSTAERFAYPLRGRTVEVDGEAPHVFAHRAPSEGMQPSMPHRSDRRLGDRSMPLIDRLPCDARKRNRGRRESAHGESVFTVFDAQFVDGVVDGGERQRFDRTLRRVPVAPGRSCEQRAIDPHLLECADRPFQQSLGVRRPGCEAVGDVACPVCHERPGTPVSLAHDAVAVGRHRVEQAPEGTRVVDHDRVDGESEFGGRVGRDRIDVANLVRFDHEQESTGNSSFGEGRRSDLGECVGVPVRRSYQDRRVGPVENVGDGVRVVLDRWCIYERDPTGETGGRQPRSR